MFKFIYFHSQITQFLVILCVLNLSIFYGLPKSLSAILTVSEQLLAVREINIQPKS